MGRGELREPAAGRAIHPAQRVDREDEDQCGERDHQRRIEHVPRRALLVVLADRALEARRRFAGDILGRLADVRIHVDGCHEERGAARDRARACRRAARSWSPRDARRSRASR